MKQAYFIRRLIMFFIVVILAATLNFIIPRLAPGDPIGAVLEELRARGARTGGDAEDEIVAAYRARFGLDQPIHIQYFRFLVNTLRFDLGHSISYYPQKVEAALLRSLPWTVGLLAISTVISFAAGSFFGALMAWPRAPSAVNRFVPFFMVLSAVPYYLLGLILIYIFAFFMRLLPLGGAYSSGTIPRLDLDFPAGCDPPWHLARLIHRADQRWLLGSGHARHNGDRTRRRLSDTGGGEGLAGQADILRLRHAQRAFTAGHFAGDCSGNGGVRFGAGRGHLQLSRRRLVAL